MSYQTLRPIRHKVLVKLDPKHERTAGGLIIPDMLQEQPTTGTVIAVGPGDESGPCAFRPGQHVGVGKFDGAQVQSPTSDADPHAEYRVLNTDPKLNINGAPMTEVLWTVEGE